MDTPPTGDGPDDATERAASTDRPGGTAAEDRQRRTDEILAKADRRDGAADARDVVSDAREMVADLEAFLGPDEKYHGLEQRRAAAVDRSHAKGDRAAAAQDRIELSEPDTGDRHLGSPLDEPDSPPGR